jgi:farnesyl-diphosphate farnesyltransferase
MRNFAGLALTTEKERGTQIQMVATRPEERLLYPLLKRVSRAFYLTLVMLPSDVRSQVALAYLLARTADSLADTDLLPRSQRLHNLLQFRAWLFDPSPVLAAEIRDGIPAGSCNVAERRLIEHLDDWSALLQSYSEKDQRLVRSVVETLTRGMEQDLTIFATENPDSVIALKDLSDLDSYIYYVAGCVGDFWTRIMCTHRPALTAWDVETMAKVGIRFGKGLQLTNVLRDVSKDLRLGRCYIPAGLLASIGLMPADLLDPATLPRFRPVLMQLIRLALEHLDQGWLYTMAIPKREIRLRLACIWPIMFAMMTLRRISISRRLLDPAVTIKMTRGEVYRHMAVTTSLIGNRQLLTAYYGRIRKSVAC